MPHLLVTPELSVFNGRVDVLNSNLRTISVKRSPGADSIWTSELALLSLSSRKFYSANSVVSLLRMDFSDVCHVCDYPSNVRLHFGSFTCAACAAFFRRTVSMDIEHVCKRLNNCPVSHAVRSGCRSCRYKKCERVGMKKENVRGYKLRTDVRRRSSEDVHEMSIDIPSCSVTSNASPEPTESVRSTPPTILNKSSQFLMDYYLELVETPSLKSSLDDITMENFFEVKGKSKEVARRICEKCPGTDLLSPEDVQILFQYCLFSVFWMDALWLESSEKTGKYEMAPFSSALNQFIAEFRATVGVALSRLKLDAVEYAVLKSLCIWKLGIVDFSLRLKMVAQEHFHSMIVELSQYYKVEKQRGDLEIAVRIADLVLLIGPMFNAFRSAQILYKEMEEVRNCSNQFLFSGFACC